jgi:hypothetical protein
MEVNAQLHATAALTPGSHWIVDWVGTETGLNSFGEERKSLAPAGIRTTDRPVRNHIIIIIIIICSVTVINNKL